MNALMKSLLTKTAYVVATLIILYALLISAVYLSSPLVNQHRADIERWATDLLQVPVKIQSVSLTWANYKPEVTLHRVVASNVESHQPILEVKRISVFISIPRSLMQWRIVPSGVMLKGSHLNVAETATGQYVLQGFPAFGGFDDKPFEAETSVPTMLTWLSQQPDLILDDIHLRYQPAKGEVRRLALSQLSLVNNGIRHTILGKAILEQDTPVTISTAIQWKGDSTDLAKMNARVYMYVTGFSLAQWLKGYEYHDWQIQKGMLSAKVWLKWSDNAWQKAQATVQGMNIVLKVKNSSSAHIINRISGNLGWKREGDNWVVAGEDLLFDLPSHLWPVTNFYLSLRPHATSGEWVPTVFSAGYLNIPDIQSYVTATPGLISPEIQKTLDVLKLSGSIQTVSLIFPPDLQDWKATTLTATVKDISFLPWQKVPGINNFSGTLHWRDRQGTLDIASQELSFKYDSVFLNSLNFEQLTGQMLVTHDDAQSSWTLTIPKLQLSNEDGAANMKGTLVFLPTQLPSIDLTANYTMQNAPNVVRYLPLKVFSAEVNDWLLHAFKAGSISSGQAEIRGNLADFPFTHNNGKFLVTGNANNVDLVFAPDWPSIKHINAKLTFLGSSMQVNVLHGETAGMPFGHVEADIPDFDAEPTVLNVKTDPLATDFANAMKYVHSSPLETSVGKMFGDVKLSGPIALQLTLKIPLSNPDDTNVNGVIDIQNGLMKLDQWNLSVSHLKGNVNFTESTTDAANITGVIFNKPLQLSLATIKQQNDSVVRANFHNNLAVKDLENWLKLPMSSLVEGATDVTGQLDLKLNQPMKLLLTSKLAGITIKLPDEYGKTAQQPIDFSADLTIDPLKPLKAQLTYGKLISAALIVARDTHGNLGLNGATIGFGTTASWPASNGLYITGEFDKLSLDTLEKYQSQASSGSSSLPVGFLKQVNVKVNNLDAFGQALSNVNVAVRPADDNWSVNISSNQITGLLTVPMKFTSKSSMTASLSRIDLNTSAASSSNAKIDAASLPAMSIVSNATFINDLEIGKVVIKTTPRANGLSIDSLRVMSRSVDLQAEGDWTQKNGENDTTLEGTAVSPNVHNLLMDLGVDAHNFVAQEGKLNFDISWAAAPYAPEISTMDGIGRIAIGKGRIVDIGSENGAKMGLGRMLSIFSLQTIPRRLSLDFSDVFQKGYSFDSIKGDFSLDDGDLMTKNLRFDGPVAGIGINGRIGLNQHNYNLVLSVTPYVTSSIPIAATLLTGNPLIGLGALAVNTVVGSQVSKVTTHYYGVTGPWNNPTWKPVSRP